MPKTGMQEARREALIDATIKEVGVRGSLDVTVSQIANRAGVSSGLAHHYFGSKDEIFMAAMRHILSVYGRLVLEELENAETPLARVEAVIRASLHEKHFEPEMVASWLAFYVRAQSMADAQRLLRVYAIRLHSNLMHDLKKLTEPARAEAIAQGMAAMIDGFYIRHALKEPVPERAHIISMVIDFLHGQLEPKDQKAPK